MKNWVYNLGEEKETNINVYRISVSHSESENLENGGAWRKALNLTVEKEILGACPGLNGHSVGSNGPLSYQ
jgi:hypothetical protein